MVGLRFKFFKNIVWLNFYVFQKSSICDSFHAHDVSMQVNNNFKVGKPLMRRKKVLKLAIVTNITNIMNGGVKDTKTHENQG